MPGGEPREISFRIEIIVEPDGDGYHAYCPALKGLHTCGDTVDDALSHAADAAVAYLESLIKHGDPIPLDLAAAEASGPSGGSAIRRTRELSVAVA